MAARRKRPLTRHEQIGKTLGEILASCARGWRHEDITQQDMQAMLVFALSQYAPKSVHVSISVDTNS